MAAWGCGAVMMSLCGEGLRLAARGAAILVVASRFTLTRPSYGAARFASQTTRAAFRPTGQPLWYNYVVPTPLLKPGSPKLPFWQYLAGNCATMDKPAHSLAKRAKNPFPDR